MKKNIQLLGLWLLFGTFMTAPASLAADPIGSIELDLLSDALDNVISDRLRIAERKLQHAENKIQVAGGAHSQQILRLVNKAQRLLSRVDIAGREVKSEITETLGQAVSLTIVAVSKNKADKGEIGAAKNFQDLVGQLARAKQLYLAEDVLYKTRRIVMNFQEAPKIKQALQITEKQIDVVRDLRIGPHQKASFLERESERAADIIESSKVYQNAGSGGVIVGDAFVCVAVDAGWEEHRRGHVGQVRATEALAERSALRLCESLHGRCKIRRCKVVS